MCSVGSPIMVVHFMDLCFFDVGRSLTMISDGIDTQTDDLGVAFGELGFKRRHVAKLGGADRSEVFGMRKQDGPTVSDPLMKADFALGCLSGEIRCFVINS